MKLCVDFKLSLTKLKLMNKSRISYPDSFLEPDNMIKLYAMGAFPMAESRYSSVVNWYLPEIRTVIPLDKFHIPRSLKKIMSACDYEVKFDSCVMEVISKCAEREDTWISDKLMKAYLKLYQKGNIHTVEIFSQGDLVGGLYGITYHGAFMGESMFSTVSQASKIALVHLTKHLIERNFLLLDVQYQTDHLKMFGAEQMSLDDFNQLLRESYKRNVSFTD